MSVIKRVGKEYYICNRHRGTRLRNDCIRMNFLARATTGKKQQIGLGTVHVPIELWGKKLRFKVVVMK